MRVCVCTASLLDAHDASSVCEHCTMMHARAQRHEHGTAWVEEGQDGGARCILCWRRHWVPDGDELPLLHGRREERKARGPVHTGPSPAHLRTGARFEGAGAVWCPVA